MSQALLFQLGSELYGLEIDQVQEVVEAPELHYIPKAPRMLLGALNFHGRVVPVLDLASFMGFETTQQDCRIVVLTAEHGALALAVGHLRQIVPVDADGLYQPEEEQGAIGALFNRGDEVVSLIDLQRLLKDVEEAMEPTGGGRGA